VKEDQCTAKIATIKSDWADKQDWT